LPFITRDELKHEIKIVYKIDTYLGRRHLQAILGDQNCAVEYSADDSINV